MRTHVVGLLVALMLTPTGGVAQVPETEDRVSRILETSKVRQYLPQAVDRLTQQLLMQVPAEDTSRVLASVRVGTDIDDLHRFIVGRMAESATDSTLTDLEGWLFEGAVARVDSISEANDPEESLEEYARSLQSDPPPRERLLAVAAHVQAQQAAGFYVLAEEVDREVVEAVMAHLEDREPEPIGRTEEEFEQALHMYFNVAVVSFLQRFEEVPTEMLVEATERYSSPAGQWYVDAYSLAMAEAFRDAGERIVAHLEDSER